MVRILLIAGLLFLISEKAMSQFAIMGGVNGCYDRNHHLLENQDPIVAYQFGFALKVAPFKKSSLLSLQSELMFNEKGYAQNLDKVYTHHFDYLSLAMLLNYQAGKETSVNTGLEISGLVSTNVKEGLSTYRNTDLGLVLGAGFLEKRRVHLYVKAVYGLIPMLDYYFIDQLGNFTGRIHDLKNMCISAGIKINLSHEKILLFK